MTAEETKQQVTTDAKSQVTIKDPYKVLGVSKLADDEKIKASYYVLVKKYSPEYYPDEFIKIRTAYDMLREPEDRAKIDINLFNPAPSISYEDYPFREEQPKDGDHHLSLFKLNQELQQILGDRDPSQASADEVPTVSHILRGKIVYFCDKQRWDEAEEALRLLVELHPDDVRLQDDLRCVRWMEAFHFAQDEQWQDAGRAWFDLQQEKGGDWRLTQNLALVAARRIDKEHEDEWWRETLKLWNEHLKKDGDDNYIKALIIALHHLTGGRLLEGGAESLGGSLALAGSGKELGMACMQRGNWPAAVEAFESVIDSNENDVDLLCQLGWAYLNTNHIPKAFQMWNRAKKLAPDSDSVKDHLVRGNLTVARRLKEQNINNQALVHYKNVLRFAPENLDVRVELGETYMGMQNFQAAAKEMERVLELDQRHKVAKQMLRDAKRLGNLR